ncbi:MAG: dephospho-CoA kinase [Alteromonadaceae bacterium]|nr:dephospho-CoA kinase [Alteromonadaceae bacterium]
MSEYIIGLTGGIGCGKSTISNMFTKLGIDVVDADIVARQVVEPTSPALKAIADYFGTEFICTNGELNRSLLRSRIFKHSEDKLWLNNLLHPLIRQTMLEQINNCSSAYCLLVAPLLIENKLTKLVDRVLVIDVSEQIQLSRTIKRDKSSTNEIQRIIASQISREKRIEAANDIVNNESDNLADTEETIKNLHQKYLQFTEKKRNNDTNK